MQLHENYTENQNLILTHCYSTMKTATRFVLQKGKGANITEIIKGRLTPNYP